MGHVGGVVGGVWPFPGRILFLSETGIAPMQGSEYKTQGGLLQVLTFR